MRHRLRYLLMAFFRPDSQHLFLLEAVLIGLFWIQALRYLVGTLYSQIGSGTVVVALNPASIASNTPGVIQPETLSNHLSFLIYVIALPLLLLVIGRLRWVIPGAVILTAAGRALMLVGGDAFSPIIAAEITLGGGLVYIGMIIRRRTQVVPFLFILALSIDQVFRAIGNTLDPSWSSNYADMQIVLSLAVVAISFFAVFRDSRSPDQRPAPSQGLLTLWGGIGLGALLFLQLSLLALPNAIAGRAGADYTAFVPFVLTATMLPLIPWIRRQARSFIALFEGSTRGWVWMLLMVLLLVIGTRIQNIQFVAFAVPIGGIALLIVQFGASMLWWWLIRPQAEKERNLTGLWLIGAVLVFALLVVFDNFTYDYAFVRETGTDIAVLNSIVPTLLRGFRGMGLGVLLLAVFLAVIPMIQTPRRIPWSGGTWWQSTFGLFAVIAASVVAALAARPPQILGVRDVDRVRVATYNIHAGFNEFFHYDVEGIARTIQQSGANVVLLQEIEAGRLTSFGVDQPLWLARRLGMDVRFYPTNEGLHGLAVLSNIEIVFDEGHLLTSTTHQTGLQRVQVRPDAGVITLYNTWLGYLVAASEDGSLDDREQQTQLNEIFGIISRDHPSGLGRTVIGGTFNNVPDSPLVERLQNAGFNDPFAGQPIELSATLRRTGLRTRFDYLWVRTLLPLGAVVMDSSVSDHRLAVVEVLITGRADQ